MTSSRTRKDVVRIGVVEAATILGCHPNTVRNRIRANKLSAWKSGVRVVLDAAEVEASVKPVNMRAVTWPRRKPGPDPQEEQQ